MYTKGEYTETLNMMKSYSETTLETFKAVEIYLSNIYIETLKSGKTAFPKRIDKEDFEKKFVNFDLAIELFKQKGYTIRKTPSEGFIPESIWII